MCAVAMLTALELTLNSAGLGKLASAALSWANSARRSASELAAMLATTARARPIEEGRRCYGTRRLARGRDGERGGLLFVCRGRRGGRADGHREPKDPGGC